jgi:methionyl-tRNA formyltransferase
VRPRVVFLGNDPWSAIALSAYLEAGDGAAPALVVTRVPRPAGRGSALRPTAVADLARARDLPLVEAETARSGPGLAAIRDAQPHVLAVVAYGELLPRDVLDVPSHGCVNLHFSLLPRWRGAAPVQWAILAGDPVTGVTTMLMDEGLDTGPILQQTEVPVAPGEDAGSLGARLAGVGGTLLHRSIASLTGGTLTPMSQPREGATSAPKLAAEDRRIAWSETAATIDRRVRAFAPDPAAGAVFRGGTLKVLRGEPDTLRSEPDTARGETDLARGRPDPSGGVPGTLLAPDTGVPVLTGEGVYRLLEVAPAGRRRMSANDWARGARFEPGEILG